MTTTDAVLAFDVTRNIVEAGSIATTDPRLRYEEFRGSDGRYYSPFGIAQSLWNIPFYLAGSMLSRSAGAKLEGDTLPKAVVALATIPAVAVVAWACFTLLVEIAAVPRTALVTVLLLVFGTPLWPYSSFGFNQPLAAMFLWLSLLHALVASRDRRHQFPAGVFAGLAILTRHEMFVAAFAIGLWIAVEGGRGRAAGVYSYGIGLLPCVAIWAGLNWWRFGNPLQPGYLHEPALFGSTLNGLLGLLFSPYASLFLYCPLCVLSLAAFRAMWRQNRNAAVLFGLVFVTSLALYASMGHWRGGRSYGPRYLLPLLPALVLPLAFWHPAGNVRRIAAAVVLISVAVQVPGVLVDYSKVREQRAATRGTVAEDMRWSGMPLLLNARATIERVPQAAKVLTGAAPPPRQDARLAAALSNGLDIWWLHLLNLGVIGPGTALLIGSTLASAAVGTLARALSVAGAASGAKA